MYGQYDSSDGSMDAMGLNADKRMYQMSGIESEQEHEERLRREYEEQKNKKGFFQRIFGKK